MPHDSQGQTIRSSQDVQAARWSPCPPPAGGGTPHRRAQRSEAPARRSAADRQAPASASEGRRGGDPQPRGGRAAEGRSGPQGAYWPPRTPGRAAQTARGGPEPHRKPRTGRRGGRTAPATARQSPEPTGGAGRGRAIANPRRGPPMRPTFGAAAEAPKWGRAAASGPARTGGAEPAAGGGGGDSARPSARPSTAGHQRMKMPLGGCPGAFSAIRCPLMPGRLR